MKRARSSTGLPQGRAYGDGHHAPGWAGWNTFTQPLPLTAGGLLVG